MRCPICGGNDFDVLSPDRTDSDAPVARCSRCGLAMDPEPLTSLPLSPAERRQKSVAISLTLVAVVLLAAAVTAGRTLLKPLPLNKHPVSRTLKSPIKTVYVTRTGNKYHRASCRYVEQSAKRMERSEAESRGFTPCSECQP